MATRFISFAQTLAETAQVKRHLLLGNGFSIALFPKRFQYGSLLEEANFGSCPEVRRAFDLLGTTDFEVVIEALRQSVALLPLYAADADMIARMAAHAEVLKELLVQAIAGRHPERPSDVTDDQYAACRAFLANFVGDSRNFKTGGGKDCRGNIYTLNYDLLLYWTLLHDQVLRFNADDPLASVIEDTEPLEHDDGFRAPDDDPEAPYVTWDAEGAADQQNIHFLHGALHLFDYGADLQKKCWERSGGVPLVDQIREALADGKFPLFVAEGNSGGKLARIRHSGFLQRSLKSFASICRPGRGHETALFIFGHSLAKSDEHVLHLIEKGKIGRVYVSLYGDRSSDYNRGVTRRAERIAASRDARFPLEVAFFDAEEASVWG